MSNCDKEFDLLWDKATELISHVSTLVKSIGDLFQQDEYDAVIKIFGIHFQADLITAMSQVAKARFGCTTSLVEQENFNTEQTYYVVKDYAVTERPLEKEVLFRGTKEACSNFIEFMKKKEDEEIGL